MPVIKDVIPTFFVVDIARSLEWYERVLGFKRVFVMSDYAGIELGPARIHLAEHKPALKGACYLRLESGVDEYIAAILARGQQLTSALRDHDYGMREATVRDPDGNDLYVGQPLGT